MLRSIKLNLEEIESMLYFWQASRDRERVSEQYLNEVAKMPGISSTYDNEFDGESVRKVLSAITNRELLSSKTQKEGRFWNNNMWMMEDLSYTDMMVKPLKRLNLDSIVDELVDLPPKYEEIEVIFSPLHLQEYVISGNKLIINFFKVKPNDMDDEATINGLDLKSYIKEKVAEMFNNILEG